MQRISEDGLEVRLAAQVLGVVSCYSSALLVHGAGSTPDLLYEALPQGLRLPASELDRAVSLIALPYHSYKLWGSFKRSPCLLSRCPRVSTKVAGLKSTS